MGETIRKYHGEEGYMLCPHSAVCLATAHFAKFGDACSQAVSPLPEVPKELSSLWTAKTRSSDCPNDAKVVQAFVERRIEQRMTSQSKREERKRLLKNAMLVSAAVALAAVAVSAFRRR